MTQTLRGHNGLLIVPVPGLTQTDVYMQCADLLLLQAGDCNSGAQGPNFCEALVKDANAWRTTNWGFKHSPMTGIQVSTAHTGYVSGIYGMDSGSVQANSDIWLWCRGNSATGDTDICWSHQSPNSWPAMPTGWDSARPVFWNHTDASGHMYNLSKIDYVSTYCNGYGPVVHQGAIGSVGPLTSIALTNMISPTGGGCNSVLASYGTNGYQVMLGIDANSPRFWRYGHGSSCIEEFLFSGYAGTLYAYITDPNAYIFMSSFDDTI